MLMYPGTEPCVFRRSWPAIPPERDRRFRRVGAV